MKIEDMPFDARKAESSRLRLLHASRLPVIVKRSASCSRSVEIDKSKFLVPEDITTMQFVDVIRKRIRLNKNEALFLYCNSSLLSGPSTIRSVYSRHCSEDGFLYVFYALENTFG